MPDPEKPPREPEPVLGPDEEGEFLTDLDGRPVDTEEPGIETNTLPPPD